MSIDDITIEEMIKRIDDVSEEVRRSRRASVVETNKEHRAPRNEFRRTTRSTATQAPQQHQPSMDHEETVVQPPSSRSEQVHPNEATGAGSSGRGKGKGRGRGRGGNRGQRKRKSRATKFYEDFGEAWLGGGGPRNKYSYRRG